MHQDLLRSEAVYAEEKVMLGVEDGATYDARWYEMRDRGLQIGDVVRILPGYSPACVRFDERSSRWYVLAQLSSTVGKNGPYWFLISLPQCHYGVKCYFSCRPSDPVISVRVTQKYAKSVGCEKV